MADGRYIEFDVDGVESTIAWLRLIEQRARRRLRGLIAGAGTYATYWMRIYAPIGESAYLFRHIDQTQVRWRAGGAGGGGEWEVISGVRTGTSRHPIYVHNATGIYAGRNYIRPQKHGRRGGVLTFQKRGEPRKFRRWVRGQRAQPFAYAAYQQARLYVTARTMTFGRELLLPD
jgi:hypothetical protein